MRRIFNIDNYDKQFKELGYIIVDLIDHTRAKELYNQCVQFESNVDAPFYTSLWSSNLEYRTKVDKLIQETLKNEISELFYNYSPLFGDLLVKRPSLLKEFPIHQDWTFVDEQEYTSVYIWCPLQDVNYLNGNLQVVEKSHKYLDKIRGANITVSYENIKQKISKKYLKNIKLKAGQAIIFNQALLHASPPNRSLKTRIAMGLLMLPNEAKVYHYFKDSSNNDIKQIEVDKEFFMNYSKNIDFKLNLKENNLSSLNFQNFKVIKQINSQITMEKFEEIFLN
jgi:hypothetical protein